MLQSNAAALLSPWLTSLPHGMVVGEIKETRCPDTFFTACEGRLSLLVKLTVRGALRASLYMQENNL